MSGAKYVSTVLAGLLFGGYVSCGYSDLLKYFYYGQSTYLLPLNNGSHGNLTYHNDTETYSFTYANRTFNTSFTSYEFFAIPGPELTKLRLSGQRHVSVFENAREIGMVTLDIANDRVQADYPLFDISQINDSKGRMSVSLESCPVAGRDRVLGMFLFQKQPQNELYVIEYFPDDQDEPRLVLATNTVRAVYQNVDIDMLANFHIACVDEGIVLLQLGTEFMDGDRNRPSNRGIFLYQLTPSHTMSHTLRALPDDGIEILSDSEAFQKSGEMTFLGVEAFGRLNSLKCTHFDPQKRRLYAVGYYLNQVYSFTNERQLYLLPMPFSRNWTLDGYQTGLVRPQPLNASSVNQLVDCSFNNGVLHSVITRLAPAPEDGACMNQTVVATLNLDNVIPQSPDINLSDADLSGDTAENRNASDYQSLTCEPDVNLAPYVTAGGVTSLVLSTFVTTVLLTCWHTRHRVTPDSTGGDPQGMTVSAMDHDSGL